MGAYQPRNGLTDGCGQLPVSVLVVVEGKVSVRLLSPGNTRHVQGCAGGVMQRLWSDVSLPQLHR